MPYQIRINPDIDGSNDLPTNFRGEKIIPWLVAIAFFMQMLDSTILNTALPAIAKSMGTNAMEMHYIIIAYVVTVALIIPISGWVTDKFGIKSVFFSSIFIFTLGSLCCAFSNSLVQLTISRVLQAVGGALLSPVGRLIILKLYPRERLLSLLTFVTLPGLVGPLFGPFIGGFLVEYASWHWIFFINIPVGVYGCWLTFRWIPSMPKQNSGNFDLSGLLLISLAMLMATVGIESGGSLDISVLFIVGLIIGSFVCIFLYFLFAKNKENALFPLSMFKINSFTYGTIGILFSRISTGAIPFLTPLLLQLCFDFQPMQSGLCIMPFAAGSLLSRPFVEFTVEKLGYRNILTINTFILGILTCSLSFITINTPIILMVILFTFVGAFSSIQYNTSNSAVLIELPKKDASSGNTMLSMILQISLSMGVGVGAALLAIFRKQLNVSSGIELTKAFSYTYFAIGLLTIASSFIFLKIPSKLGKKSN